MMDPRARPIGPSDAFVVFGVTGDLARRKIFPALHAMARRGTLNVPVVGVARGSFSIERLREEVRASVTAGGKGVGVDERALDKLLSLLSAVQGDYDDPATFASLRQTLGNARAPLHYLAIPPSMFTTVAEGLARSGCNSGARLVIEKPFGRDLASARELDAVLHAHFPEKALFRIDHYLGKEPVQNLVYFHLANRLIGAGLHRNYVDHVQIVMAEELGVEGRGRFYEEVGALRDVVQNHVLQLVACLAMECPANPSDEAFRDEMARVLKAIRPLSHSDVVRGQYAGYTTEKDVARDSRVETFAALSMHIDNERWEGVPFLLRAGKRLPLASTEILVRFKPPLWTRVVEPGVGGDYLRLRIGPDMALAQGLNVKTPGTEMRGELLELCTSYKAPDELGPYERLFGDALQGDTELFARSDMVEAQWAALDGVLDGESPVFPYEQGTWGPVEADALLPPGVAWHTPSPLRRDLLGQVSQGGK
jgi:glucose-6-phosphate 1-dehydrogenase